MAANMRAILGGKSGGGEPPKDDGWEHATPELDDSRLPEWASELKCDKKGNIENTFGNACVILMRADEWRGLRFDEFRGEPCLVSAPEVPGFDRPKDGPLDDYSIAHIWQWISLRFGIGIGVTSLESAAIVASKAKGRAFHPVRDYLRGLEWDGVARLDSWLTKYASVAPNEYTSAVGRMWLIGAVARTMKPGAICKTMPILEGPQDAGKSTLLRAVCPRPEWFSDTPIDIGKQGADKYQVLRGKLIVEIPELDGFRGKDARSAKAFFSSPVDNFRASFGKRNQDVPRQCVFAGTTNEERYFQDHSGNVRFWPVRVGEIDVPGLELVRDQLWAEALDYYTHGAPWHITDPATIALARAEQEAREEEDPWLAPIVEWLKSPIAVSMTREGVTTHQVMTFALAMQKDKPEKTAEMRVGIILRKLKFKEKAGHHRPRIYVPTVEIVATRAAPAWPSPGEHSDFGPEEYDL